MDKVILVGRGQPHSETGPPAGTIAWTSHAPTAGEPAADPDITAVVAAWLTDVDTLTETDLVRWADAYLVEERKPWDYERDWPDGAPSPGVKRLSFLRSTRELLRPDFAARWAAHITLARRHHPTLWRYVQNIVVRRLTPGTRVCDGIAELSFRELADLTDRMYDSPAGRAAVGADVRGFIDPERSWRVLTTERVIVPPPDNGGPRA